MKKYLTFLFFLLLSVQFSEAQTTFLVYGKVNSNMPPVPASGVKVLVMEVTYSGIPINKSICNRSSYPSAIKVFITDSKGEYNFRGLRKGVGYRLIFCNSRTGKVYLTELQIPTSASHAVRVPDQNIH